MRNGGGGYGDGDDQDAKPIDTILLADYSVEEPTSADKLKFG